MPFTTLTPPIILTFHRKHVPRQAHPLLRRGLGRQRFRLGETVYRGLVSTHIPPFPLTSPPSEGLGEAPSFQYLGSFFPVLGPLHPLFFRHFVLRLRLCGLHLVATRIEFYGIRDVQTTLIINRNINGNILITVRIG